MGKPLFITDRFYDKASVGVGTGLAWTSMGGATLYVEAVKVAAPKTEMKLTGQAGQVMKESSEIAWSFLQSNLKKYAPKIDFFPKTLKFIFIFLKEQPRRMVHLQVSQWSQLYLSLLLNVPH